MAYLCQHNSLWKLLMLSVHYLLPLIRLQELNQLCICLRKSQQSDPWAILGHNLLTDLESPMVPCAQPVLD